MKCHLNISLLIFICFNVLGTSCTKLVDPGAPTDGIDAPSAYSNDINASASVNGIYSLMAGGSFANGSASLSIMCGLSADEFSGNLSDISRKQFYINGLLAENSGVAELWSGLYKFIYSTNGAVEGLTATTGVSAPLKAQLLGEVKFLRAFYYFYLVNLFGDVPLALTTDYRVNRLLKRTDKEQIYQQIIADLKDAQLLLTDEYRMPNGSVSSERVRPNKTAAEALLARVYLYRKDWVNAEEQATAVIDKTSLYDIVPLNDVFLMNSKEAIWQLQSIVPGYNTLDANELILISDPLTFKVTLSSMLLSAFESGDIRRSSWVGKFDSFNYAFKYKVRGGSGEPVAEYLMVLRLAEQYLIRAEARAHLGKLSASAGDLNIIRVRAGLPVATFTDKVALLTAVEHERQVELFCEWGHRWFDLKRTDRIDAVMQMAAALKSSNWTPSAQLYPLPRNEMNYDPNLRPQNPGYN